MKNSHDDAGSRAAGSDGGRLALPRLKKMLREMLLIRRVEERSAQLYQQRKIAGFLHLYIGQEAIAVGANEALRPTDHIITTYRDHAFALVRGISAAAVLGEMMGREIGCAKGRGGSMHMFNKAQNFHGGHGIIGAHCPLGAGFAFASKYQGKKDVTVCLLGDGAVPNGAFHEACNLAGVWSLPIVFIIENNEYAMGTPLHKTNAVLDMTLRAQGYNMKGILVEDGSDTQAVFDAISDAAATARDFKPVLMEIRTNRFRGHSMSDPAKYRTKEQLEELKKSKDPISRLFTRLLEEGAMDDDDFKAMDEEVKAEVDAAAAEAEASPQPDPSTVGDYVYSDPVIPGKGRR